MVNSRTKRPGSALIKEPFKGTRVLKQRSETTTFRVGILGEDVKAGEVIEFRDGKWFKEAPSIPEHRIISMTIWELMRICKSKHYRSGRDGILNYDYLKRTLNDLGLSEDQIKQCLHP